MQSLSWIENEVQSPDGRKFARRLAAMKNGLSRDVFQKMEPVVEEIRRLKREKNAVVLSHYYMPAYLQIREEDGGVADFVGDSLGLSLEATKVQADYIIFCGVQFMAETAYILNPEKKVLLPSFEAGCSLASSINGEQVRQLKAQYPGAPVVAYVNTYAETKAECDVCVTSRNAVKILNSFKEDTILFVPDKYMGRNLINGFAKESGKRIILWDGSCEVHEQFRDNIHEMQEAYPDAAVLLHWEVPDAEVNKSLGRSEGILGSTTDIMNYVGRSDRKQFILASECDLGAALKGMYPEKEFITPCIVCQYMKKIHLGNTLDALRSIGKPEEDNYLIKLDSSLCDRARVPIQRMLDLS